ncbi:MAG TPA: DUF2975 domain-containing protein [Vicinamibacterales bacterium]|nr:DUF2975 domain-containing protein [Vicinamibacterales bacterium]
MDSRRNLPATLVSGVLAVARGLVTLGLALTAFFVVVAPFTSGELEIDASWLTIGSRMTIPVRFYVDSDAHRIAAPSIGVSGAELRDTHGSLRFPAPEGPFLFLNAAFLIALFLVAIWGLGQLQKVVSTMRKGQPFVAANAKRLRRVAVAVVAGEVLRAGLVFVDQFYAKTHFTAAGLLFDASFNVDFFEVFLAFVIFAIAEVFAAGTRLDEDHALTI